MRYFRSIVSGEVYSLPESGPVYTVPAGSEAVAVIAPDDREQMECLSILLWRFWETEPNSMKQAAILALREFANPTPPKPDEPQGLGAVVEDAEGLLWIRQADGRLSSPWYRRNAPGVPRHCSWDEIAAVKILSEGVQ